MERALPVVDILGTPFYVDVLHEQLRQKDNDNNRIPFSVFDQEGEGYTFLYDTELKAAPEDLDAITDHNGRYQWVTLPALMELDPEGIAFKYDIPLEILCPDLASLPPADEQWEEEEDDELDM